MRESNGQSDEQSIAQSKKTIAQQSNTQLDRQSAGNQTKNHTDVTQTMKKK